MTTLAMTEAVDQAIDTLERARRHIGGHDVIRRTPTPESKDLVAYEFQVGRMLSAALSACITSICNQAQAMAVMLDEYEELL